MTRQIDRPGADPADNTAVLLRDAFAVIDRVVPLRLAERGHGAVRVAHGVVFQHLDEDGSTVSTLAQRAGMTKQAMAGLVQHLEHHGYLRRVPDPADRRAKLVRTTPRGREVIAIAQSLVPEMERRIIGALGVSRWHALREDLRAVRALFAVDEEAAHRSPDDRANRPG